MINLAIKQKNGFGLIGLLIALALIGLLFFTLPTLTNQSKNGKGYIEHQIEIKKNAESQIKGIQDTLKKRYKS